MKRKSKPKTIRTLLGSTDIDIASGITDIGKEIARVIKGGVLIVTSVNGKLTTFRGLCEDPCDADREFARQVDAGVEAGFGKAMLEFPEESPSKLNN